MILKILLLFIAVDIISGLIRAWKFKEYKSRAFREGLMNKAGYILVIMLAYQLDLLLFGGDTLTRTAAVFFYIAVELSSIVENLGQIGVPIPKIISDRLIRLQEKADDKKGE